MALPTPQTHPQDEDARVDEIVRQGPYGTFALAGVAAAIVVLIYFAFYLAVYLPRGVVQ
jgi:hypothetical protein